MLQNIKFNKLNVSDMNVRKSNKGKIQALSRNILAMKDKLGGDGLIQPITVKKVGSKYEVIAGQRRLAAIGLINKKEIIIDQVKCNVIDVDNGEALQVSLSENVFQHQMGQFERFRAFQMLIDQSVTVSTVAKTFGTTVHKVKQYLALSGLLPGFEDYINSDNLREEALFYLTRYDHKQQQIILDELKQGDYFHTKGHIKMMLDVTVIDPECAQFDLDKSGLAIITDLFSKDKEIHDVEGFINAQRVEIQNQIKQLESKNQKGVFIDTDESFSWANWKQIDDEHDDACTVYELLNSGTVNIRENMLYVPAADKSDLENNNHSCESDDLAESQKPARQEITKKAQNYYMDWHWQMAKHALMTNKDTAYRYMMASLITQTSISFKCGHKESEVLPSDLASSKLTAEINEFLSILDEFEFGITSWEKQPKNASVRKVFNRLLDFTDDQLKDILVAIQMMVLRNNSALVHDIGTHLNVDVSKHFKITDDTIETFTTKDITSNLASEVMSDIEAKDFEKLSLKDRRVKLAEVLDEGFLPKFIHFKPGKYNSESQDLDFQYENLC